jgi:hypothetical protein
VVWFPMPAKYRSVDHSAGQCGEGPSSNRRQSIIRLFDSHTKHDERMLPFRRPPSDPQQRICLGSMLHTAEYSRQTTLNIPPLLLLSMIRSPSLLAGFTDPGKAAD